MAALVPNRGLRGVEVFWLKGPRPDLPVASASSNRVTAASGEGMLPSSKLGHKIISAHVHVLGLVGVGSLR